MRAALVLLLVCATSTMTSASIGRPTDLETRARGAARIVVAVVTDMQARFDVNEHGDQLIVTQVMLSVDESLKGSGSSVVAVDVEGGTIGDLTLRVSDMPTFQRGERAVFFLSQGPVGNLVPHRRGLGVLKLDAQGRIRGSNVTLAEVRAAVRASR